MLSMLSLADVGFGSPHVFFVLMSFMVVAVVVMLLLPVCVMPVSIPAILTPPIVPSVSPALIVVIRLAIFIDVVAL